MSIKLKDIAWFYGRTGSENVTLYGSYKDVLLKCKLRYGPMYNVHHAIAKFKMKIRFNTINL